MRTSNNTSAFARGGLYGPLFAAGALGFQRRRPAGGGRGWMMWPALTLSAGAYRAPPAEERATTIIMGESYIVAAYIDVYAHDLPAAYSSNRSYESWQQLWPRLRHLDVK
ncbi:hypothetical protein NONO_c50380 [Nocardia nova SH22a]|uniref:Uncharacterized protein n=1 Tax=Nocardia nova SH22a TaxID=1415166 RepID=W5TKP5_9NOCA|nr:hypothetical protein [Nocardia nova]AHH19822.1 hypothetical protein NONO_c50380 [Nocardia nova SH22a]